MFIGLFSVFFHLFFMSFFVCFFLISFATCFLFKKCLLYLFISSFCSSSLHPFSLPLLNFLSFLLSLLSPRFLMSNSLCNKKVSFQASAKISFSVFSFQSKKNFVSLFPFLLGFFKKLSYFSMFGRFSVS